MKKEKSLLFITSSCLGDAVLTTGVLARLVEENPGLQVTIACGPVPAPLFEAVPQLKGCLVIKRASFARHWFRLWRKVVPQKWTYIVDFRGTALSFFLRCTGKRWVWRSAHKRGHQVERVAQVLGVEQSLRLPPSPFLWTDPSHEQVADDLFQNKTPVIAISPASNWPPKTWPLSHWQALLPELVGESGLFPGARVLLMGAAHERPSLEPLMAALPQIHWIDTVGQMPLLSLYACLKRCQLFVGNDSGLMHLAAASGVPTVGLFGPTNAAQYGPWGRLTQVAQTPGGWENLREKALAQPQSSLMTDLTPALVLEKISGLLAEAMVESKAPLF